MTFDDERDWQQACLSALRFGIAELQKPRVIEVVHVPEPTDEQKRIIDRWAMRAADAICDGELDT
jgi:hypothetical protein